jgi:hypothetical protein
MKKLDFYAARTVAARSRRALNNVGLEVIQDASLLSMEVYHLGKLAGIQLRGILNRKERREPKGKS